MVLKKFGLTTPESYIADSLDEAVQYADLIGYPVVLKIQSPDIFHKTDIGGVVTNISDSKELAAAYNSIMDNVRSHDPEARIEGAEVQEMVQEGIEIILGLLQDSQFGLVIMFGMGGIFTEIYEDVSFRVLPITRDDALSMIHEIEGYPILSGFRGSTPVSEEMLVDLLLHIGQVGYQMKDEIEAVDLNPIVVWEDEYRVLDAKIYTKTASEERKANISPNTDDLEKFFEPQSIAVIGASDTKGKVGYGVLDSLLNHEYLGKVYPVNPSHSKIMGVKSYPSVADIPGPVDLAVLTTNIKFVPEILSDCKKKDVHNLVIISGGGKELGGESTSLEKIIRQAGRDANIRMIGPNCTGVFDGKSRVATFFQTQERMSKPKDGPAAFMTQSGTVGNAMLEDSHSFGVRNFVSYGNRVDVDEGDLLAYWGAEPDIKVIGMYVEGFENGRKFLNVVKQVSSKKPVIIYKAARTKLGAKAAASHTGNLGGSYKVVEGALRQSGALTVDSYEELISSVKALAMQPAAKNVRVGMISNGAGPMIQGIDRLYEIGIQFPELSSETILNLEKTYPSFYIIRNPIDITGSGTSDDYVLGIKALLEDQNIDIVMPWFVFVNNPITPDLVKKLGELNHRYEKPILAGAFGGEFSMGMMQAIEEQGIPVYHAVPDWISAARAITWRAQK